MSGNQPRQLKKAPLGKRCYKGNYIVTYKLRRKNAKRHILARFDNLDQARAYKRRMELNVVRDVANYHIYNGVWEVIE